MYVCMHVCMHVCIYVFVFGGRCNLYVCMYVWMHVCMYVSIYLSLEGGATCMHVCMYVCMHVWMDGCMCVCMDACLYLSLELLDNNARNWVFVVAHIHERPNGHGTHHKFMCVVMQFLSPHRLSGFSEMVFPWAMCTRYIIFEHVRAHSKEQRKMALKYTCGDGDDTNQARWNWHRCVDSPGSPSAGLIQKKLFVTSHFDRKTRAPFMQCCWSYGMVQGTQQCQAYPRNQVATRRCCSGRFHPLRRSSTNSL
jgi:hypothetical protein